MAAPALSVLMPVRDAAAHLQEALASLAAQTEKSWELIAVDDGSTDDSLAILRSAAARDPRIRVLACSRNGLIEALNTGLADVRTKLIARMDADDRMHPQRLEHQRAALEDAPEAFAVSCRVQAFPEQRVRDGMKRYLDWQNSLVTPDQIARERFVESPLIHPSVTMRTDVLRKELGGWHDRGWPEDWDLFLRAFELGKRIWRLPEFLYEWRLHDDQATTREPRYGEDAFRRARAHFLARHLAWAAEGRGVWVFGAGPIGKKLGKALAAEGVALTGFADIDPKKIGGTVRAGNKEWPVADSRVFRERRGVAFGIVAVGAPGARERVRGYMRGLGWKEGEDFVVAA